MTPVLLLWDDFSGHWTREVTQYAETINVVLMRVPPSATSVSQPADVAWNKPLKQRLRGCWVENLRTQLAHREEGKAFKLVPPSRREICEWVVRSWAAVSQETIQAGFRGAHLAPQVDEIDSEVVHVLERLHLASDSVCSDDDIE